eukprot:1161850-Pelagomonas_calceolata.AAC.17
MMSIGGLAGLGQVNKSEDIKAYETSSHQAHNLPQPDVPLKAKTLALTPVPRCCMLPKSHQTTLAFLLPSGEGVVRLTALSANVCPAP